MSAEKERLEQIVCGRHIGYATGWDQSDTFCMTLYDFEPVERCGLPKGDISIDFERGHVQTYDDNGKVTQSVDLIDALKSLPFETK